LKPKHWFVFLLLGTIWSSSFLWIKIAVQEVGPMTLVAFRVLFGMLFGLAVVLIQRPALPRRLREWFPVLLLGITNVAIPFFLISWGEQSIDSGVAAILDATVPLFTILLAHYALHDDKMTVPKVLGLLTGFAGVTVLMSSWQWCWPPPSMPGAGCTRAGRPRTRPR
jgi:drug/metabolite transporter (DMT)-like permease